MRPRKTGTATSSGKPAAGPAADPTGAGSGACELPVITVGAAGLQIGVRVSPSAPRNQVRGVYGDRLKVAVSAPPEDNRANNELIEALAGWLHVGKESVRIEAGHTSRDKVVSFTGIDEEALRIKQAVLVSKRRS